MSAALIATTLTAIAAPAIVATPAYGGLGAGAIQPGTREQLYLPRVPEGCDRQTEKAAYDTGAKFKRLDQLPWGVLEHAVLRSVGGCPVREVVYQGQTYWVPGSAPRVGRATPESRQTAPTRK